MEKQYIKERIKEKLREIEEDLEIISEILPQSVEEYKLLHKSKKWGCERGFENITEAITSVAFLIIKDRNLEIPEEDISSFIILEKNKIISHELCQKLKEAKGMRNIVTHEYGKVDDVLVFDSLKNELERDVSEFTEAIKICLQEKIV